MSIEIARRVRVSISDAEVRRIISHVIASTAKQSQRIYGVRLPRRSPRFTPRNDRAMSVAFIGPQEMRRLNRTYHAEDRVTDVLAFGQPQADSPDARAGAGRKPQAAKLLPLFQGGAPVRHSLGEGGRGEGELGELVVCPSYVREQAKRAGEPSRRELTRVLVHGTLHLLGEDHATPQQAERMFGFQEQLVQRITKTLNPKS